MRKPGDICRLDGLKQGDTFKLTDDDYSIFTVIDQSSIRPTGAVSSSVLCTSKGDPKHTKYGNHDTKVVIITVAEHRNSNM